MGRPDERKGGAVVRTSDEETPEDRAELLNSWNRRSGSAGMLCPEATHGPMVAVEDPATGEVWWLCPQCEQVQPVATEQITAARGIVDLPETPRDPDEAFKIEMPDAIVGDRRDGTVRVPYAIRPLDIAIIPMLSTVQWVAAGAGASLAVMLYLLLPSLGLFALILLLFPVLGAVLASNKYPATKVLHEMEVSAIDLEPGLWVRLGSGGRAAGLATRVVQLRGLDINHRYYPGVEVQLLNGMAVECRRDDGWVVIELG